MPTYLLNASACPALPVPTTALQNPTSETPLVGDALSLGDTMEIRHKWNRDIVRLEMLGRHGGGCYAVQTGLNLAIGATLHVTVAAGCAVIDAPITVTPAASVVVPNTITNGTIWLTQAGALVASSTLAPPAGNCCLLGLYSSAGGVVTAVDESGVLRLDQGLFPMRQTADVGCPADSPPVGLRFLNKCPGGLFLWDGVAGYQNLTNAGRVALNFASDANKTLLASEYSNYFIDFAATGTTLTAQRNVVVPLSPAGRPWLIRNNSPGAQAIQIIGASGTGQVLATGATGRFVSDGTNIITA